MPVLDVLRFVTQHPLNRRRPLRALASVAAWQLGSRMVPGEVVFNWVENSRLVVKPGQTGLTGNVYCGLQEFSEMGYLLHALRPGELFVDVGANLGSYTVLAAAVVGADVICIEPVPETYAQLELNVRLNRVDHHTECVNSVIGREQGVLQISTGMGAGNRVVSGVGSEGYASKSVPATTLDLLLAGRRPTLIKVDVEGFETAVVEGAARTLSEPSLHSVIMEVNGSGCEYGFDQTRLLATMRDFGFEPHAYDPTTRGLRQLAEADPAMENCIFIRDFSLAAARVQAARRFRVHGSDL